MSERLRTERRVDYKPESFELGRLASGEIVIGDLDGNPDIHIPDNDFARRAKYRNTELINEALGHISAEGEGYGGEYIVRSHTFPVMIGVSNCVKTRPGEEVIRAFRPSKRVQREYPTRYVIARVGEPTQTVTFILQRPDPHANPNKLLVRAGYMGERVEPEPAGKYKKSKISKKFWRTHALVLYDLAQLDLNRPITRGDQGPAMSEGVLEDLFEATEREFLIEKTIEHMRDGEFGPRYIQMAKEYESQAVTHVNEIANHETGELVEREIKAFAYLCLLKKLHQGSGQFNHWQHIAAGNIPTVDSKEWEKLLRFARHDLKNYLTRHIYLPKVKAGFEYALAYKKVTADEQRAVEKSTGEINGLIRELSARKNDPALVKAACSWTNAPDSDGNIGRSGRGFSGGLVHFFEYRSGIEKRERFKKVAEPMTVDGFLAFTNRLKIQLKLAENLLEDPEVPSNDEVIVIGDKKGNRRYYILQPNKDLIIAYQKKDREPKLSTLITGCSRDYVESVAQASIDKKDKKVRMNKLGPENIRLLLFRLPANIESPRS